MKKHKLNLPKLSLKKFSIVVLNDQETAAVNGGISGTPCHSVYLPCIPQTEFDTCRDCRYTRALSCEACIPATEYVGCGSEPI